MYSINGVMYMSREKAQERARAGQQAGKQAQQLYNQGAAAVGGAVGAAQQAYIAANKAFGNSKEDVTDIRNISGQVGATADQLETMQGNLAPDAQALRDIGGTLKGQGEALFGESRPFMDQAAGMINLDTGAGGIAGEFAQLYKMLSPDALVSFASTATTRAAQNNREQLERNMSRMGVSVGSTAFTKAMASAKKYEDALVSSVKTKTHIAGLEKMSAALAQGVEMAAKVAGIGTQYATAGIQAEQAATGAYTGAADVEAKRAGIVSQAGELRVKSGDLLSKAASVETAGINALVQAGGNLSNAQTRAAEYYSTQAASLIGGLQSGFDFRWLF